MNIPVTPFEIIFVCFTLPKTKCLGFKKAKKWIDKWKILSFLYIFIVAKDMHVTLLKLASAYRQRT